MTDNEENTVVPVGIGSPSNSPQVSGPCLIVLRGQNVGQSHPVQPRTLIGRDDEMEVCIEDDPSVSRSHAELVTTDNGFIIRDRDSSYGTFVNGDQISECNLCHGDILRIGDTLLKFLCDGNTESAYHDEIYRLTTTDPLTGIHNERFFLQELQREVSRCVRYGRPCHLTVFRISGLARINEKHGNIAGDRVLRQIARQLPNCAAEDDLIGRCSGPKFAVLLPNRPLEKARRDAETLCQLVSSTAYSTPDGSHVKVSVSAGISSLSKLADSPTAAPEEDNTELAQELRQAAEYALYAAQRLGDEQVIVYDPDMERADSTHLSGIWRRPLSRTALIETVQTDIDNYETVIACELAREKRIIDKFGIATWEERNQDFINVVSSNLGPEDQFHVWKDRCVLVALHETSARDAGVFEADIRQAWADDVDELPADRHDLRELCFATLSAAELKDISEETLGTLIGRLNAAEDVRTLLDELPYPISILYTIPPTRRNSLGRVRAMIDVLDVGCRFLTAIAVSILFDLDDDDRLEEMAETLKTALGRSPSLGAWLNLAFHLARLLPQTPRSAAHQVALSLLDEHENSSELKKLLDDAVALRNDVVHGRMGDEEAYEDAEAKLSEAIDQLVQAMRPLADTRLVSVDSMQFSDDPNLIDYELRLHRGPTAHFPIIDESFTHRLVPGWCYLIDSDNTPLSLAPFLFVEVCDACNRAEMFLTEKLVFGPRDKELKAKGLTTNHEAHKKIAWTQGIRQFYETLQS